MATIARIPRPNSNEHIAYYGKYIELVPDGDFAVQLGSEMGNTVALLRRTPADREDFAYAPGKWTVKETVGHMTDVERVMGLRALWFARADAAPLPGFDENAWVPSGNFADAVAGRSHGGVGGGARRDDRVRARARRVGADAARRGQRGRAQRARLVVHHRRARTAPCEDSKGAIRDLA